MDFCTLFMIIIFFKKFLNIFAAYKGRALRENPDKTFYLAWDLLPKDNPAFHNKDYYSYEQVEGQNKLRTPQINNISLKVWLEHVRHKYI